MLFVAQSGSAQFLRYDAGPIPAAALPVLSTQGKYHAQDELGQYAFGHHEPNQVRSETKDAFGIVRGSYSYANADGSIVTNNYIADENGFRSSLAPSNGPVLPLVGKAPKVPIVAAAAPAVPVVEPARVALAAPAVQYVAQPTLAAPAVPAPIQYVSPPASTVLKYSGAHVAPAVPAYSYGYGYGVPAYTHYPYGARVW